jgi:hypothetical protein
MGRRNWFTAVFASVVALLGWKMSAPASQSKLLEIGWVYGPTDGGFGRSRLFLDGFRTYSPPEHTYGKMVGWKSKMTAGEFAQMMANGISGYKAFPVHVIDNRTAPLPM